MAVHLVNSSSDNKTLTELIVVTVIIGVCGVVLSIILQFSNNNNKKKNESTSKEAKAVGSSEKKLSSSSDNNNKREILVCPFSSESTFILENAEHLEPTPLDLFDEQQKEQQHEQQQYLGTRWLVGGISGQDQPGYLRAQLKRLRHQKHFLLQDHLYKKEILLKEKGFDQRFEETFVMESASLQAQQETLELFISYLPKQYPNIYKYNKEEHTITAVPLNRVYKINDYYNTRPLELCGRIVQEDLVLMREDRTASSFYMAAAAVVFSFNDLPTRLSTDTNFIHKPVPGFQKHLNKVLYHTFKNIHVEKPLWRNNWNIVPSGDIDAPSDSVTHELELQSLATKSNIQERYIKVEYQTIRKLPKSNYLLFTIRTFTDPITSLEHVPSKAAKTLAASIRGMTSSKTLEYRGIESEKIKNEILQYLDSISHNDHHDDNKNNA